MSKFIILLALLAVGSQARPENSDLWAKISKAASEFEDFVSRNFQDALDQVMEHLEHLSHKLNNKLVEIQDTIQGIREFQDAAAWYGHEVAENTKQLFAQKIQDLKNKVKDFVNEASKHNNGTANMYLDKLVELLEGYIKKLENESSAARSAVSEI